VVPWQKRRRLSEASAAQAEVLPQPVAGSQTQPVKRRLAQR
jgi:hypothetical protein